MTTDEQDSEEARATVAATLLRLGFLSGEEDPEEEAIVEAISTILPDECDIGVCVSYNDFSSTQALEEKVSAQVLSLSEVLGAVVAGKHGDVVHVWVDQGPTLAFQTEPAAAQALQVYVDMAAS